MTRNLSIALCFMALIASSLSSRSLMAGSLPDDSGISSPAERSGAVRGRVVDIDHQTLPGAAIYIESKRTGTFSDAEGYYSLAGLTPGVYTMKVSYVGYKPVEMKLTVQEGKTTEGNIVMSSLTDLNEVVVNGAFSDQARAINTQRNNLGVTNVVSADQVGKFPDSNIGDALKRISGINVQYDQGEARFGQVRGTPTEMTSVTVNGNRLPSAEGGTRSVQLDLIPSDMVSTIEVNKSVTADMDGDAVGGAVNLVTKSAPSHRVFNVTLGSGYNVVSEKMNLVGGISWGNRFFDNKLGVMAAISYQRVPGGSDNTEFEYVRDDDNNIVLDEVQVRQYYVTRERQSYSLSLDYAFNSDHRVWFKGLYNRRNDWENRYRVTYRSLSDGDGKMGVRVETKGGADDTNNRRLELQQTMDFTFGGDHLLFRKLETDWSVSYSRATEARPNERYMSLELKKQTLDVVDAGGEQPYVTNSLDLSDFSLRELTNGNEDIAENEWKAKLDFQLPLSTGDYGNRLRFGAKYTHKNKEQETTSYDYTDSYEATYGDDYMNNLTYHIRDGFYPGSQYKPQLFIANTYIGNLDFNALEGTQILEESSSNYDATEQITAAYLRFDQNLGRKFLLTAGLRMEATHVNYQGMNYEVDENDNESLVVSPRETNSYINLLPSLLAKWDISDDWKLRASFTHTIARPDYEDLVPTATIDRADEEISVGNTDLEPAKSYNLDLSTEYYFPSIGLASLGVFYKRINGFIVEQNTYGDYSIGNTAYENYYITQVKNAGDCNLFGVELAFQRDFSFIAPALKCFGLYGTYTYTYTSVKNFNFEGRENESGLSLPGSPKHTANVSLYFEKKGWNLRLSYNFASSFIDEMGEVAELDRYYDSVNYLDLNASYSWGRQARFTVYGEATNLLNQPLRYYQGTSERTMQVEYYGVRVNAGIKIAL